MAELFRVDGSYEQVTPKNGTSFELEELYELLETDAVEAIWVGERLALLDEDGKMKAKPLNKTATLVAARYLFPGDYLVGNVIFCKPAEFQ